MEEMDLYRHTDTINELLARYGVKFGIYKNNTFKEQLFPFDAIPRIITASEFEYLEKGLKQRVLALNAFIRDIYGDKLILRDKIVPEEFIFASSGYLAQCEGILPPKGIYTHISGIDLVQGKNGQWYILEDNLRVPSGASYPMIASFYMPGAFVPHIRMMKTGFENVELAKQFGLPYVVLHTPRPFDTTTLNYNWQIWETQAFSLYTTNTSRIDRTSARQAVESILNFMSKQGILRYSGCNGFISRVIESEDFVSVRTSDAGFFESVVIPGEEVEEGQLLAKIRDPYLGTIRHSLYAPVHGTTAFVHDEAMTYENTAVLKLIRSEDPDG